MHPNACLGNLFIIGYFRVSQKAKKGLKMGRTVGGHPHWAWKRSPDFHPYRIVHLGLIHLIFSFLLICATLEGVQPTPKSRCLLSWEIIRVFFLHQSAKTGRKSHFVAWIDSPALNLCLAIIKARKISCFFSTGCPKIAKKIDYARFFKWIWGKNAPLGIYGLFRDRYKFLDHWNIQIYFVFIRRVSQNSQ